MRLLTHWKETVARGIAGLFLPKILSPQDQKNPQYSCCCVPAFSHRPYVPSDEQKLSTNPFNWVTLVRFLDYIEISGYKPGDKSCLENVFHVFFLTRTSSCLVLFASLLSVHCGGCSTLLTQGEGGFLARMRTSWGGPVHYEPAHGRSLGTGWTLCTEADSSFPLSSYILPAPGFFLTYLKILFLILPNSLHFWHSYLCLLCYCQFYGKWVTICINWHWFKKKNCTRKV